MSGHPPPPGSRNRGTRPRGVRRRAVNQARHGGASLAIAPADPAADEAAWFDSPWNDGRNAVRLLETLGILAGGSPLPEPIRSALAKTADEATALEYASVDAAGVEASFQPGPDGVVWPAAAGCLANWLARSHGGGHVPNVFLRGTVGWLLWRGLSPDLARWEIGRARARDLGLDDGATASFTRLWHGRRYRAAWALAVR